MKDEVSSYRTFPLKYFVDISRKGKCRINSALVHYREKVVPHSLTQAMRLMMRLYIILMPRSLCVCVRLGVTFTFIFIINY